MRSPSLIILVFLAVASVTPLTASANEAVLVIENHRFQPEIITVPANQRVRLSIENRDATPEEFESHDMKREKVIPGNTTATVWIGPLEPGEYGFVGEFNEDTAKGAVIAK
jgi:plastocyanin domain-containing protein